MFINTFDVDLGGVCFLVAVLERYGVAVPTLLGRAGVSDPSNISMELSTFTLKRPFSLLVDGRCWPLLIVLWLPFIMLGIPLYYPLLRFGDCF